MAPSEVCALAFPGCSAQGSLGPVRPGPHSFVTLPEASLQAGGDGGWPRDSRRVAVAARAHGRGQPCAQQRQGRRASFLMVELPRRLLRRRSRRKIGGYGGSRLGAGHGAPFVLIMVTGLVFHRVPSFQQFCRSVIHKSYGLLNSQCAIITSIFTGMSIRSARVGRWHTVYPGRR